MPHPAKTRQIRQEGLGPSLPAATWEFKIDLSQHQHDVWERLVGVIERIVEYDYDSWPDDNYWRGTLPEWLASTMMTLEECRAAMARTPRERWDELPWEFGSWLDAIRERGWEWWGYERSGNQVRVVLKVIDFPPRIAAFKQILLASGASILSETY